MGMYRTVVLEDGLEVQFKTGDDSCEQYEVGDKVDRCTDGLYDGLASYPSWPVERGFKEYAVLIRNGVLEQVMPIPEKYCERGGTEAKCDFYAEKSKEFGVESGW